MILEDYSELLSLEKDIALAFGCFDILHVGHIKYLRSIANRSDLPLAVGLLDDALIGKLKGKGRPVLTQHERLQVIDSIRFVDYSFVITKSCNFNRYKARYSLTEREREFWCKNIYCIECLKPKQLYYSTDFYLTDEIRQFLTDYSISAIALPYTGEISTTAIIDRIKQI